MEPTNPILIRPILSDDLPTLFAHKLDAEANDIAAFTVQDPLERATFDAHGAMIMTDPGVLLQTILYEKQIPGNILYKGLDEFEVSYWLGKEFWGKGIATEALRCFPEVQTVRPLYARAVKDNFGSIRVLEKYGFVKVGEGKTFANARGMEVEEWVLALK